MIGGAEGDRTPDLMTASHALSQLSYGPKGVGGRRERPMQTSLAFCVESSNRQVTRISPALDEGNQRAALKHVSANVAPRSFR